MKPRWVKYLSIGKLGIGISWSSERFWYTTAPNQGRVSHIIGLEKYESPTAVYGKTYSLCIGKLKISFIW